MTHRGLFIGEGSSDLPLADHIEAIAADVGVLLEVSRPDLARLPVSPGRDVTSQVRTVVPLAAPVDVVFVHRDADREAPSVRKQQVLDAVAAAIATLPAVAVVPVRMTEAWLVLDERPLRMVAGNPSGREVLCLPGPARAESDPDPKRTLKRALQVASGLRGRRLRDFDHDFGHHRRQLLERLDLTGPVTQLASFQAFKVDVEAALKAL
jgi:hypothetical protein